MNIVKIPIGLPNGYEASLLFRQFQPNGDWICQASDECITDLQDILQGFELDEDTGNDSTRRTI